MSSDKIKCTAVTAAGKPCKGWAITDSIPPRCAPHSGLTGAPKGNTNAVTHGFYQKCMTEEEVSAVFAGAEDVTLVQEAILIRVVLRRLMNYLADKDTPPEKITAVAPLIFTGSRALTYVEKHLPDPNALDWKTTLDQLGEEWGWDL